MDIYHLPKVSISTRLLEIGQSRSEIQGVRFLMKCPICGDSYWYCGHESTHLIKEINRLMDWETTLKNQAIEDKKEIERLKGKLKGSKGLFKLANEYRMELATVIEDARYTLITEINNYDEDSMLQMVIRVEKDLRMEDVIEPDFDNYDPT